MKAGNVISDERQCKECEFAKIKQCKYDCKEMEEEERDGQGDHR